MTGAPSPLKHHKPARISRAASFPGDVAVLSAESAGVAIAACLFELPAVADTGLIELQVTPAGAFVPRDGREMSVDAWRIDATSAAQVIARFQRLATPPVLDYEHQTLRAEDNGHERAAQWHHVARVLQGRDRIARRAWSRRMGARGRAGNRRRYRLRVRRSLPRTGRSSSSDGERRMLISHSRPRSIAWALRNCASRCHVHADGRRGGTVLRKPVGFPAH